MKEQEKYKQMMNEIHVSETTLRKVMKMDMSKNNLKKKRTIKKIGTAAAALLLCLVASNGICYAATGQSLVAKAIIYINGEVIEKDVVMKENDDGSVSCKVDVPEASSSSVVVGVSVDEDGNVEPVDISPEEVEEGVEAGELHGIGGSVVEKDGKQYFEYQGGKIDITEDLADGKASGTITEDGVEYCYEITGENGEYSVNIVTKE